MSQMPPLPPGAAAPAYNPQPQKGNVAAVISLITGILFCIPGLGLIAIILGIVGVSKANKPNTGGKGMAIAGIILGVVGLIVTAVFAAIGGGGLMVWRMGAPARTATHQFVVDISAGNESAAMADCTKDVDPAMVKGLIEEAKQWGAFKDTTLPVFAMDKTNGSTSATITGVATFDKGNQPVFAKLQKEGDTFKVAEFVFATQKQ